MTIFYGQRLYQWRLWGVWFRRKYFVGFSAKQETVLEKALKNLPPTPNVN